MIYFVRDAATGLVKIGYSENPWLRLCKMQSDCPGNLTLVGVLDGDRVAEFRLHAVCAAQRVRGEWFRNEGPVAEAVGTAEDFVRPTKLRAKHPTIGLMVDLCAATGVPANAVRGWIQRGRVPGGYIYAVDRAGVMTIEQMCRAAAVNGRRGRKAGAPLNVTLQELATKASSTDHDAAA